MTEEDYYSILAKVNSGMSISQAAGSASRRTMFQRMRKKKEQEAKQPKRQAERKKKDSVKVVSMSEDKLNLSKLFPEWPTIPEELRELYRAGYRASLRCGEGSHFAKIWSDFIKAVAPERFKEKKNKIKTVSLAEYRAILTEILHPTEKEKQGDEMNKQKNEKN